MKVLRILIAIPVVMMLVAVAKAAQYTAVDAFGPTVGFDIASLFGVLPVIALYIFAAAKLPRRVRGV